MYLYRTLIQTSKVNKMNYEKRSRKLFFVATAVTILALSSVLAVYAAVLLGTINGGNVTVAGVTSGTITYNTAADGSGSWTTTLEPAASSWYTKLALTGGYSGPVTITWQLQSYATGSFANVGGATVTTTITLTGSAQGVYATANGAISGNHDWHTEASSGGTYRVIATINSAP
jgi:hypothetical protein